MVGTVTVPVRRVFTGDHVADDAQRTAQDTARKFNALSPFVNGILITEEPGAIAGTGLSFTSVTPRTLAHGLGRTPIGYVEVGPVSFNSTSYVGLSTADYPTGYTSETHLSLLPLNTGKCFLWVF